MPRHFRSVSVSRLTSSPDAAGAVTTTLSQIQHEVNTALSPLHKRAVLDHTLQFLQLGEFARAARVSRLWHGVTVGGGESSRVWKRGIRRGNCEDSCPGETGICKGRRLAFWSAMCNIRNCVADPSAGSLTRCLCEHSRNRDNAGGTTSLLFDHEAGGDLAFSRREGVFPSLEKWAQGSATTDWEIALASKVSGAISRFRRCLGAADIGRPLDALFDRVAVVAKAYAGFAAIRDICSTSSSYSSSYPAVFISALADLPRAAGLAVNGESAMYAWLDAGAQAVPLLAVLLWDAQHYSSTAAGVPFSASHEAPRASYDGGDPLVLQIENEDAFWALAVMRESLWFDLQHMQNAGNKYHDLRELLRIYTPDILSHLDALNVRVGAFVSGWFASGFTALCAPGPALFHIWDVYVTEGRKTLYRAAIQVLLDHKAIILQTKRPDSLLEMLSSGEGSLRIDADKVLESSFVRRMLTIKVTRRMIAAFVLRAGQEMSLRSIVPPSSSSSSSSPSTASASERFDASAEWRAKLESRRQHTMPLPPGGDEDHVRAPNKGTQDGRILANLSGVSKDLRRAFFSKVEAIQSLLQRPIQLSAVSSRLIHRMGAPATKALLVRIESEEEEEFGLAELKSYVLKEEMCMKLEEKIPEARPKWSNDLVKACAEVLIRDNSLAGLISLSTSRSRLESGVEAFEETDEGTRMNRSGTTPAGGASTLNPPGSISGILEGSRNADYGNPAKVATKLRRAESRRRSIIARVPTSEESYYIESSGQLEGPFSRNEMRYWCDKRLVGPSTWLRVVVTDPRNFVLVPDLGPGVFHDAHGCVSECPFPDNAERAPSIQTSDLYPEWFRAFRTIPRAAPSSITAIPASTNAESDVSSLPSVHLTLSSPGVIPPPPPPRRESFFSTRLYGSTDDSSTVEKDETERKRDNYGRGCNDDDDDDDHDIGPDELRASAIPNTLRAFHDKVNEDSVASARASASLGHASMPAAAATKLLTLQEELGRANEELAALRAQLASIEEDNAAVRRLKSEVSHLKSVAVASRNTISRLESALMAATNRADEVALQKRYEEEEVTALVESYRKEASDAKELQRTQDTKIQGLVSDLENSVFLERENDKLGVLLAEYTKRQRELEANLDETNAKARRLAVENIKLKRICDGQNAYHESVTAEQERRNKSLIERERKVTQRERDVEANLQEEFLEKMTVKNAQRIENEARLQRVYAEDIEQLQQRLLYQFESKMQNLRQEHEKEKKRLRGEHASAAGRWDVERRRLEQNVHDEHARTVKELHGNLLGEVNTITSEFRRVYNTAKQRAEDHANEGWSSESMQSRIMLENRELKEAIINQNIRAKEMYSELERRLKENDKARQRELAAAHKAAHDAKAGEFRVVFK